MTVVQFGSTGASTAFGQFSSKTVGSPQTTQLPAVIMALAGWLTGWTAAAVGAAFNPYLEDMNGFCLVVMYFLANLFERGISDWDAGTTYFKGATVQDPAGSGQVFASLTDNNLNQALPLGASNAQWLWTNPPAYVKGAAATVNALPKVSGAATNGPAGSKVLTDSAVSEDGTNVKIALPLKFPDNSVQSTAATAFNTQNVVTGSRALNTTYQNTGTKPLFVTVTVELSNGAVADFLTDAASPPVTEVARMIESGTADFMVPASFIVLPGNYYRVNGSAPIRFWTEWS